MRDDAASDDVFSAAPRRRTIFVAVLCYQDRPERTAMDQPTITLVAGLITAGVTILGWRVTHAYTRNREIASQEFTRKLEIEKRAAADERADRLRLMELHLNQANTQMSEFYGPIYTLIQQVLMVREVNDFILQHVDTNKEEIAAFIKENYFFPLHHEISDVFRGHLHLIESTDMQVSKGMRDSFKAYLDHVTREEIQHRLWREKKIPTHLAPGREWPEQFPKDIKDGWNTAMQRYEQIIAELGSASKTAAPSSRAASGGNPVPGMSAR
jgi:hypothetical protein